MKAAMLVDNALLVVNALLVEMQVNTDKPNVLDTYACRALFLDRSRLKFFFNRDLKPDHLNLLLSALERWPLSRTSLMSC